LLAYETYVNGHGLLHGNMVSVKLLLLVERFKVGFDEEGNNRWRAVGEVVLESVSIGCHFE